MTTLAEGSYFLGFAALLNSIVHYGTYVDQVFVGYRGDLPDWLPPLTPTEHGGKWTSPSGVEIHFVTLEGSLHMVHEKPKWMHHFSTVLAPDATEYYFFDSDIVVSQRMNFYGEWVRQGVAVCGDVLFIFDHDHPHRKVWASYAAAEGREVRHTIDGYYNSGFLGWSTEQQSFIDDWNAAFAMMEPHSGNMHEFRTRNRTYAVLTTNQDSFNLALMITDQPIAPVGPEAMGFVPGMRLMYHPIGPKPWLRSYWRDYFKGRPPRTADVKFWEHVNGTELSPISSFQVKFKLLTCKFLRFMGRFYRSL